MKTIIIRYQITKEAMAVKTIYINPSQNQPQKFLGEVMVIKTNHLLAIKCASTNQQSDLGLSENGIYRQNCHLNGGNDGKPLNCGVPNSLPSVTSEKTHVYRFDQNPNTLVNIFFRCLYQKNMTYCRF